MKTQTYQEVESLADKLYTAYCNAVGGVSFKGEELPSWKTFREDSSKAKQSDAWHIVAQTALTET